MPEWELDAERHVAIYTMSKDDRGIAVAGLPSGHWVEIGTPSGAVVIKDGSIWSERFGDSGQVPAGLVVGVDRLVPLPKQDIAVLMRQVALVSNDVDRARPLVFDRRLDLRHSQYVRIDGPDTSLDFSPRDRVAIKTATGTIYRLAEGSFRADRPGIPSTPVGEVPKELAIGWSFRGSDGESTDGVVVAIEAVGSGTGRSVDSGAPVLEQSLQLIAGGTKPVEGRGGFY